MITKPGRKPDVPDISRPGRSVLPAEDNRGGGPLKQEASQGNLGTPAIHGREHVRGGAIVATYREIAEHFGLANPEKGRQKAKRAEWPAEPANHPSDPLRVRVPQDAWEGASLTRERAARAKTPGAMKGAHSTDEGEDPSSRIVIMLDDAVGALREALTREREAADQLRLDLAAARAEAAAGHAQEAAEAIQSAVALAEAVAEVRGLREALAREREELAKARRPFWRRWIG